MLKIQIELKRIAGIEIVTGIVTGIEIAIESGTAIGIAIATLIGDVAVLVLIEIVDMGAGEVQVEIVDIDGEVAAEIAENAKATDVGIVALPAPQGRAIGAQARSETKIKKLVPLKKKKKKSQEFLSRIY